MPGFELFGDLERQELNDVLERENEKQNFKRLKDQCKNLLVYSDKNRFKSAIMDISFGIQSVKS